MIGLIYLQFYTCGDIHVATNYCLDCTNVEEELS
jgi:hypothetical protein